MRFSNAYGPRSAHKGNVIPLFIRRLRAGEDLVVFGDGSQTRDFVFCEDLAAGLIAAALTPGAGGQIFQLASGVETPLNRLLELLAETSGITPRVRREPPRQGEIQRNYSLIDKARDVLGYSPQVDLEQGLRVVVELCEDEASVARVVGTVQDASEARRPCWILGVLADAPEHPERDADT